MGALSLYKIVRYIMFLVMWTGEILLFSGSSTAQVRYLGGPIMQTNAIYIIFWLPTGFVYDPTVPDGVGITNSCSRDFSIGLRTPLILAFSDNIQALKPRLYTLLRTRGTRCT